MTLTNEIKTAVKKSVLCWLATVSSENLPNVSPKEVFDCYSDNKIIIANIASPQSQRNIESNPMVCVSFIDILVQKGYKVVGQARIVNEQSEDFLSMQGVLNSISKGKFPFKTIIEIAVLKASPIIAPSYLFYPNTTEEDQVIASKFNYGLKT